MPCKRDEVVGGIDDNSSCCITSSSCYPPQSCISTSIVGLAAARRLHRAHAHAHVHEAAGSSGGLDRCTATYAPPPRRRRLRSLLPSTPWAAPPPGTRLLLPLGFAYIKGSSRMRSPAAAANDLGSGVHASPCWWPTETTQWSESLRMEGLSISRLSCHVRVPGSHQRLCPTLLPSFRWCTVQYTPAECLRTKTIHTTQPDRQFALSPAPRTSLDLHFGPWQASRVE